MSVVFKRTERISITKDSSLFYLRQSVCHVEQNRTSCRSAQNCLVSASTAVLDVSAMNATTSTAMNHQLAQINALLFFDTDALPSHIRVSTASMLGSLWKPGGQKQNGRRHEHMPYATSEARKRARNSGITSSFAPLSHCCNTATQTQRKRDS